MLLAVYGCNMVTTPVKEYVEKYCDTSEDSIAELYPNRITIECDIDHEDL